MLENKVASAPGSPETIKMAIHVIDFRMAMLQAIRLFACSKYGLFAVPFQPLGFMFFSWYGIVAYISTMVGFYYKGPTYFNRFVGAKEKSWNASAAWAFGVWYAVSLVVIIVMRQILCNVPIPSKFQAQNPGAFPGAAAKFGAYAQTADSYAQKFGGAMDSFSHMMNSTSQAFDSASQSMQMMPQMMQQRMPMMPQMMMRQGPAMMPPQGPMM